MSTPPVKTSALLRWLSVLMVVAAIVVRFRTGGAPVVNTSAPAPGSGAVASSTSAPARSSTAQGIGARSFGADVGFHSRERLKDHFHKHGREFHCATAEDYLRLAQALRDRPVGGDVREMVRADGVVCRYDRASGAFIAFGADGVIRTFFRPNDGERYFERQASRPDRSP